MISSDVILTGASTLLPVCMIFQRVQAPSEQFRQHLSRVYEQVQQSELISHGCKHSMNISNVDSRVQAPTHGCKYPPTGASTHQRVQVPTHGCKHPPMGASTHPRVQAPTHGFKHPPTGSNP